MPTRIAQLGCGRWGENVLRDLLALGAEVSVVARGEDSVARAEQGGAQRVVRRLEDVGVVDGIVIVTPAPHHAEAIRAAAGLDVPIFCEKPLVTDPSVEPELTALCGERLFVMHKWRWHPGVEALAGLAAEGRLGELSGVRSTRLGWGPFHFQVDAIDTLAPHDFSIGLAILGELPPLAACSGTPFPGIEDGWAEASALFADGARPYFALDCSAVSAGRLRRIEVTGSLGSAVLPDPEAPGIELLLHGGELSGEAQVESVPLEREWPLLRELRDFVDHCAGGPPPKSPAAEGFAAVRAVYELREALGASESRAPAVAG